MADEREGGREDGKFYAVCLGHDVCLKNGIPVLYKIYSDFSEILNTSKNVKLITRDAINIKSYRKGVVGNETSDGGVITGVKGADGCVYARSFTSRVRVNKKYTFGYHDFLEMNCKEGIPKGNCVGKLMWLDSVPASGPQGNAPYVVFDRDSGTLEYHRGDGSPPKKYDAHNNTVANNKANGSPIDPTKPGAGGAMPNGWHRIGETTGNGELQLSQPTGRSDVNSEFGKAGKIPVDTNGEYQSHGENGVDCDKNATKAKSKFLPDYLKPAGSSDGIFVCKRDDLAIHPGRENKPFEKRLTKGCIRVNEEAMEGMQAGALPEVIQVK